MTKLLNLDELAGVEKEIQLRGKIYPILDRSVGQVIKAIEASKNTEKLSEDENLKMVIGFIHEAIPDCPVTELKKMPFSSLNRLMDFINASEAVEDGEGKS